MVRAVFGIEARWSQQNHPCIDGNKRVAVRVTGAFLMVNGYRLQFTDEVAFSFLIGRYETRRMRFDELDAWLRQNAAAG